MIVSVPSRISKHYTSVIGKDQYDLNETDAVLEVIFTEEIRRKRRRTLSLWLGFTSIFFIYISFLLTYFYKQWTTDCIRQLSVWLAVYEGIIILQLARSIFLIYIWRVSRDP